MNKIEGTKLKRLDFELMKGGDLLYMEGPILSHFRSDRGMDYLMVWADVDDDLNRWLLFYVETENLHQYFLGKLSLLHLIEKNNLGAIYIIDINSLIEYEHIWLVENINIPDNYLPKESSFYNPKFSQEYAKELAQEIELKLAFKRKSLIDSLVRKLFDSDEFKNIAIHLGGPSYSANPNEHRLSIAESLQFPLLITYHQSRDQHIKNLIETSLQIYQDPITCRTYLFNVHESLVGRHHINHKRPNIRHAITEIVEVTKKVVDDNPIYLEYYEDWLSRYDFDDNHRHRNLMEEATKYIKMVKVNRSKHK